MKSCEMLMALMEQREGGRHKTSGLRAELAASKKRLDRVETAQKKLRWDWVPAEIKEALQSSAQHR